MARKELEPGDITVIIDTREQRPLDLSHTGMKVELGTLSTGDYSIKGLENVIAIERKSLDDLIGCVGVERDRFEREMQRILAYPHRALVVEASYAQLVLGGWRSRVTPQAACASVDGWAMAGVPIIFAGCRVDAERAVARMLYLAARRRWREAQALVPTLRIATAAG